MRGTMRDRVVFARLAAETDDGLGLAEGVAFNDLFSGTPYRCEFRPERFGEKLEAGRITAPATGKLKVRKDSQTATVEEDDRATINGEPYQIRGIDASDLTYLWMVVERDVAI